MSKFVHRFKLSSFKMMIELLLVCQSGLKFCFANWVWTASYQAFHTLTMFDAFRKLHKSVHPPTFITAEMNIYTLGGSEHHLQQSVK